MASEHDAVRAWWSDNEPQIVRIDSDAMFIDVVNELAFSADQDALDVEKMFNDLTKCLLLGGNPELCDKAVRAYSVGSMLVTVQINPHSTLSDVLAELNAATDMYLVDIENAFDDLAMFILKHTNKVLEIDDD